MTQELDIEKELAEILSESILPHFCLLAQGSLDVI